MSFKSQQLCYAVTVDSSLFSTEKDYEKSVKRDIAFNLLLQLTELILNPENVQVPVNICFLGFTEKDLYFNRSKEIVGRLQVDLLEALALRPPVGFFSRALSHVSPPPVERKYAKLPMFDSPAAPKKAVCGKRPKGHVVKKKPVDHGASFSNFILHETPTVAIVTQNQEQIKRELQEIKENENKTKLSLLQAQLAQPMLTELAKNLFGKNLFSKAIRIAEDTFDEPNEKPQEAESKMAAPEVPKLQPGASDVSGLGTAEAQRPPSQL